MGRGAVVNTACLEWWSSCKSCLAKNESRHLLQQSKAKWQAGPREVSINAQHQLNPFSTIYSIIRTNRTALLCHQQGYISAQHADLQFIWAYGQV